MSAQQRSGRKRRTPSLEIVDVFDPDPAGVARAVRRLLAIDLDAPSPPGVADGTPPDARPDSVPNVRNGQRAS